MERIVVELEGMVVGTRQVETRRGIMYVVDVYKDGSLVNVVSAEDGLVPGEVYRALVRIVADRRYGLRVYEVERR